MRQLKRNMAKKAKKTSPNHRKKKPEVKNNPFSSRSGLHKPDVYQLFVVWMSLPQPERYPKTQKEFAAKYGIHQDTVVDYKKRKGFWDDVQLMWKDWGKEKTSDVMKKFYDTLMSKGSASDIKLWLQYFLNWAERHNIQHEGLPRPIMGGESKKSKKK